MIRIRLINEGKVVKQITSRVHEGVVMEQISRYAEAYDTVQIVEGELSEDARSMLQRVAKKIVPAAMAAGMAMSGAQTAQAQGGANPNYPGLNRSVGQTIGDIVNPRYKEMQRQREHQRSTERQVWDAEQNEIRRQRVSAARTGAGGQPSGAHQTIYDQSRISQDGKSYLIYGMDNRVRRIPVSGTEYMPADSQRLSHYITASGNVYYVRHPHMNESITEGVAESVPMDDAVKVLRQYGADHFKTTTNELHFYKNGQPFSVDLISNSDATRSVSLSQLNSAGRKLKGQGVAEGSRDDDEYGSAARDQYLKQRAYEKEYNKKKPPAPVKPVAQNQQQGVAEAINMDIANAGFNHEQQIGDYLYKAKYWNGGLKIYAYDGAKKIGYAELMYTPMPSDKSELRQFAKDTHLESEWTEVHSKYQRQGIMSTMYAYAKMLGNSVRPSSVRSDDAKAAWKSWGTDKRYLTQGVAEGSLNEFAPSDNSGKGENPYDPLSFPEFKTKLTLRLAGNTKGITVGRGSDSGMAKISINDQHRIVPLNIHGVSAAAKFIKQHGQQGVAEADMNRRGFLKGAGAAAALAAAGAAGAGDFAGSVLRGAGGGMASGAAGKIVYKDQNEADMAFADKIPDEWDKIRYTKAVKSIIRSRGNSVMRYMGSNSTATRGSIMVDEKRFNRLKTELSQKYNIPLDQVKEQGVAEGYTVTRGIDRERYIERPGLEGPFSTRSGKVVYYDKAEGKYYDPDTDFYIGHEDYAKMDEGWKDKVAAGALAATMALGAGAAHARVSGDHDPSINRLTGKPVATQVASGDQKPAVQAPKSFSKEYLQSVVDGKHPRPMISVEKAQQLLQQMGESKQGVAEGDPNATVGTIPSTGTTGTSGGMSQRTQFAPTGKTTNAKFNKNGQIELDADQDSDGGVNLDADAVDQLQQAGVKMNEDQDSPVAAAIARRIMSQRLDLLQKYGPVKVTAAIDDVADFVGDVEEIGSSDVSGWIKQVEQSLAGMGESVTEGTDTLDGILSKFSADYAKFRAGGDIDENPDFFDALYEYYFDEMPYGVKKARDGDPYEWITDRLDQEGGVAPVAEADEDSTADQNIIMQIRKASDYKRPTRIKLADGTDSVIAPNIAKQLLAKFDKMKPDSKTLLQDTLNTEQGFAEILDYIGGGVREQAAARASGIMQSAMAEAGFGRDRRDAYQRDLDHSTAGFGRNSYAYQQDGGANDEDHSRDEELAAQHAKKQEYERTGKFWLKQKDTQQHVSDEYTGKAAANAAAVALFKQQPELKGNLVITAYGPGETNPAA